MNQFSRRVCVLLVAWLTATITTGHELKHQASEHVKIKSAVLTGKEKRSVRHDVRRTLNLRLRGGSLHQTVRQGLQFAKRVPSALQDDIDYTEGKKYIFIMSDFTGFTASHILTAVLYQFPSCSHSNSVTTQVFSNVKSVLKMRRIIAFAKYVGALVCFTIRDTELRKELADECKEANIAAVDLLGDLSDGLSHFLELTPIKDSADQVDSTLQRKPLSSGYFKRIEAVDFAIKMDEGSFPENYHKADLVLVGVSRVQKTPLAMYLSQQFGLKVANTKIVLDCPAEPELLKIDPKKVFALTCQADWLLKMRRRRVMMVRSDFQDDSLRKGSIKFEVGPGHSETEYASMDYIRTELEYADSIFRQNPQWNRIDITGLSVEEVADLHIVPALPRRPTVIEGALEALSCNFCIVRVDTNEIDRFEADGLHQTRGAWSESDEQGVHFGAAAAAMSSQSMMPGGAPNATESDPFARIAYQVGKGSWETWGSSLQLMFMSEGLSSLTHISRETMVGKSILSLLKCISGTQSDPALLQELLHALYVGIEKTVVVTCSRADEGRTTFLNEVHVAPVKNRVGMNALYVVSMREIFPLREEKEHENSVRDVEETEMEMENEDVSHVCEKTRRQTFYTVLDATIDGLPLCYASKGFFKMTGFSEKEVMSAAGGHIYTLWGAAEGGMKNDIPSHELEIIKSKVEKGVAFNACFKSFRKDCASFWNLAHLEPVCDDWGTLKYYVGIHHAVLS
mmetsp:Transcript_15612/g.35740  ORF Transcript_15612/g.35740 Transcript_15612/m.35740 type:complete len:738 (-) Transcript_15612:3-2216(-)